MSCAIIGASIINTSATTRIIILPCPPPLDEELLLDPVRAPKIMKRDPYQARITIVPSRILHIVMSSTSRFLMWEISWAMTPCSSSRFSFCSSPEVIATAARLGSRPVAKAFNAGSSMMYTSGIFSRPEAIFISSTTLYRRGWSPGPIFFALDILSRILSPWK